VQEEERYIPSWRPREAEEELFRASFCHAADWARGRVDNSDDCAAKQKAQAPSWFAGIRFVVISPARLSSRFLLTGYHRWPGTDPS